MRGRSNRSPSVCLSVCPSVCIIQLQRTCVCVNGMPAEAGQHCRLDPVQALLDYIFAVAPAAVAVAVQGDSFGAIAAMNLKTL